ncbi:rhomboid family intramembrane serine protease [Candidatus Sumerlaeota bacterium]|nr:rhomboid family intramembrane serine protease [Candidatus Sumerlaeota bacterium]
MIKFPEPLDKLLRALGINTNRLGWKLHYWKQDWQRKRGRRIPSQSPYDPSPERKPDELPKPRKYKQCRCGQLSLASDTVCNTCGRKLPSYGAWLVYKYLGLAKPEFNYVSFIFIFLIGVFFIWQIAVSGAQALLTPNNRIVFHFGGLTTNAAIKEGQYWRLFSFALAHYGLMHVLFNSMAIYQVMPHFEREIGPWRTVVLITLTQIGAALAHIYFYSPYTPTAGASGVAAGLVGFGIAWNHFMGRHAEKQFFIQWLMNFAVFSFIFYRSLNHAAHAGGFFAGMFLGWLYSQGLPSKHKDFLYGIAGVFCLSLWIASILFLLHSILSVLRV